jgi:uncharacterized protein YjbI with pentapeptide repeats
MLMRKLVLVLALMLLAENAGAASYQRTDGTVVDPILDINGNVATYTGPDLGPGLNYGDITLTGDLSDLDLSHATFSTLHFERAQLNAPRASFRGSSLPAGNLLLWDGVNLQDADFRQVEFPSAIFFVMADEITSLRNVDFSGANLSSLTLRYVVSTLPTTGAFDLTGANFSNANLSSAGFDVGAFVGSAFYNSQTDFTGATFYNPYTNTTSPFDPVAAGWTLVPEPNTALLLGIGLAGLSRRKRNRMSIH